MILDPLTWVALLGAPAVLALHWLRRRFRPRRVSALFLWSDGRSAPAAGPRWERLRSTLSLWLECGAALLLAALLALPFGCSPRPAEHLGIVLDGSLTMRARDAAGVSVLERAVARVRAELAERGDIALTIVQSGRSPKLLAGPAAPASALEDALARYTPDAPRHDLAPSLDLAQGLVAGAAGEGQVLVVTDRMEPLAQRAAQDPGLAVAALGVPRENAAIVAADRLPSRDDPAQDVVLLTVERFAPAGHAHRAAPAVRVEQEGAPPLDLRPFDAPDAGHGVELAFTVAAASGDVRVRLVHERTADDALAEDDLLVLVPPARTPLRAWSTLPPAAERSLGLRGQDDGDGPPARLLAVLGAVAAADADHADVLLAADVAGGRATFTVVIAPPSAVAERRSYVGPYLVDRADPLCAGLSLEGVLWTSEVGRVLPGAPLVSAGDVPLATLEDAGARAVLHLALDPARSTFALSPDWPILLANVAAACRARGQGLARANLGLGEPISWRGAAGKVSMLPEDASLGTEDGEIVAPDGWIEVAAGAPLGAWTLSAHDGVVHRFAVNVLERATSDLAGAASHEHTARRAAARVGAGDLRPALLSICVTLLLLLLDWRVLARPRPERGP